MKEDIKIYFGEKKVDLSENFTLQFIYQLEDSTNPTVIKNSFSKSFIIEGTQNNNEIFGEIYNLNRQQLTNNQNVTGIYFEPSKRTPFFIYKNSDLIESGYFLLNNIILKNGLINYNVTLYGGIGDFFYNLMYDEKTGNKLALNDLYFGVEDENGNKLNKENEFDFKINKEFVANCLLSPKLNDGKTLTDYITFIPSYNGIADEIDTEKVLINQNKSNIFTQTTAKDESNNTYTNVNGYVLGKLDKKYTEYEIKDLRSYMQRPAIRFSKIIDAISNPANNGGYTVELDTDFFNSNNCYYYRTFMALPLLNSESDNSDEIKSEETASLTKYDNVDWWIGYNGENQQSTTSNFFSVSGSTGITAAANYYINFEKVPNSSLINLNVDISLYADAPSYNGNDLYLSEDYEVKGSFNGNPVTFILYRKSEIQIYVRIYSDKTYYSNYFLLTNNLSDNKPYYPYSQTDYPDYSYILGHFVKNSENKYVFQEDTNGGNTFRLKAENIIWSKNMQVELVITKLNEYSEPETYKNILFDKNYYKLGETPNAIKAKINTAFIENSKITAKWQQSNVVSNQLITKDKLLAKTASPAEYLIDFCKMFGLNFKKDKYNKKINILSRNNFFKNNIIDINNKIDRNKDIVINPLIFDSKFYRFSPNFNDSYFFNLYEKNYNKKYGEQKINTNYNFNADTKELLNSSVYQSVIPITDKSNYYRNFYDKNSNLAPAFLIDNVEYQLYNNFGNSNQKTLDIKYEGGNVIDLTKTVNFSQNAGSDIFPKICCFSLNNDEKNLSDLSSSLLIYNGQVETKDINGNAVKYLISDDLSEMMLLNNNKICYLYTESSYNQKNEVIAISVTSLPSFLPYYINASTISDSFDYGTPDEIYIDNVNYNANSTIYSRFFQKFYTDKFNINTKKVTAYVHLNEFSVINEDMLSNFYFFENSIWMLNKIDGYNINSYEPTKCEFIKVNSIDNYIKGQLSF